MRLLRPAIIFLGFILMSLLWFPANGQKVALVLSGGASKGGAHLGVLRALEENQIPIDYIAGTSIGAVIGSLYASGYTVDEIEKMMLTEEFQRWASGIMDEKYIYYYRKEDPNASWISTSFNMKKKITAQLPTNIIQPFEMDFAFMELLSPSNALSRGNFDSLFIPFRCVISDIDSSHAVVLRKGVLNQAVRASMSIPFVFAPVVMNGRLVYDGGMYNNFPADVALKEFKPDVIIGSRVAERYKNPDRDDPVSQLQTMLMNRQNDTILYPKSVLIAPELPKVNLLDFSKTKELADSGYMATMAKMGKIRELVTRKTDSQAFARKREAYREKLPALLFDSVFVTGMNKFQQAYIKKILFHGRDVINIDELKHEYFRFINEGYIQDIEPRAVYEPSTGFFTLTMDVRKSNELSVEFGGNLSLGTSNEGFLELKYRYLWTKGLFFKANGYFGRFYNSVLASARMDFNSKIPWFVEASYVFNHYDYFRNTTYFFSDLTPSYIIQREYYGTASIGMPVTNKGKTLFSIDYAFTNSRYYQSNVFSRTDTADQTSFNFVAPKLLFELNSLNRKQFANSGAQLRVGISYVNGREGFLPGSTSHELPEVILNHQWFQVRVLYDNYFQTIGPLKLGIYLEGVFSNQPLFSNFTSTMIYCPAFQPLPDMQSLFLPSFRATNFAAGGLKAVVTIYKKIEFRLEGYLFQPYKEILAGETGQPPYYGPAFSDRSYLAGATLAYISRIGPFSIGVNYYDKVQESWAFNLNFGYILFNRKALP